MTERLEDNLAQAIRRTDDPLPGGFAFFTMRKIVIERLRRAEQSARWQAVCLAIATVVLAALAVFALHYFGYGEFTWAASLPWLEVGGVTFAVLLLVAMDALLARWFHNKAST